MPTYDRELWCAAHHRFLENPSALTDEDLEQLALTDPRLAERGRAKRAGFVEAEDDFVKEHGHHPLTLKLWSHWLSDLFSPMLGTFQHRLNVHDRRLDAVELAAKPGGVQFAGTYDNSKRYPLGVLVQRHGLWLSLVDGPTKAPGTDGAHEQWRLVVKDHRGGGDEVLRDRLERLERRLTLLEGRR